MYSRYCQVVYSRYFQVVDSWKTVEFNVMSYKDYKDVYILGNTDDIQQLLDDSNINIQTIQASRHVGPIKPKVDEWAANLALFYKTLVIKPCQVCPRNIELFRMRIPV